MSDRHGEVTYQSWPCLTDMARCHQSLWVNPPAQLWEQRCCRGTKQQQQQQQNTQREESGTRSKALADSSRTSTSTGLATTSLSQQFRMSDRGMKRGREEQQQQLSDAEGASKGGSPARRKLPRNAKNSPGSGVASIPATTARVSWSQIWDQLWIK